MQPGDHAVLVDDDWSTVPNPAFRNGIFQLPVKGVVYTIFDISFYRNGSKHLQLAELPLYPRNNGKDGRAWFTAVRFRKLSRLTPETFTKESLNV